MADQYATPSATLSYVSNNDDDDDVNNMDTGDDDLFRDDGSFRGGESTPGSSCQNEGGLQKYTSPQQTSPGCETPEEEMYHDEIHQVPFPRTPQATADLDDIDGVDDVDDVDDNFESTLGERVKSLNNKQARLNKRQENVHSRAREIVAELAKHTLQTLLPQLEKMKHRLEISHQFLKELQSPPTNNAATRAPASQPPLEQGIQKDALERRLAGALQALDTACKALHGTEPPAHECREMQRAASYQEQNNAVGNGGTNNSGLTGKIDSYHFEDADIAITQAGAGNNDLHEFSNFLLPIASDGNGNMASNTGQLHSPMLGWGNLHATYSFGQVGNASC